MISIVTAYFNRKKLFSNTLLRLQKSSFKDFEVIVVDDGSNEENRLEDLEAEFHFLKVIRLDPENKWYINSCIPFNIGFRAAKGDIIIIQNPECTHYGDIMNYVYHNLKPNDYLSFAAYSLDKSTTDAINQTNAAFLEILQIPFYEKDISYDGEAGWYNHSIHRPKGFHWCTAIHKTDLDALGGFDERYALGVAFDDNELLARIQKKEMNFKIIDEPFVLHQNHFNIDEGTNKSINPFYTRKGAKLLWNKNEYLFNRTLESKNWIVKKKSVNVIKFLDLILTTQFKVKKTFMQLNWRIHNKWKRIFKIGTNS
jgi:glycosyltransferase involved in cell wall biosynthesis